MTNIFLMLAICVRFLALKIRPSVILYKPHRSPLMLKLSMHNGSIGHMSTFVSNTDSDIWEHTTEYAALVEWDELSEALSLINKTTFPYISHPSSVGLVMYEDISEDVPISPVCGTDDKMAEWMVREGGWTDPQHARDFIADVSLNASKWETRGFVRYEHPLYRNRKDMNKQILKLVRLAERLSRRHAQLRMLRAL